MIFANAVEIVSEEEEEGGRTSNEPEKIERWRRNEETVEKPNKNELFVLSEAGTSAALIRGPTKGYGTAYQMDASHLTKDFSTLSSIHFYAFKEDSDIFFQRKVIKSERKGEDWYGEDGHGCSMQLIRVGQDRRLAGSVVTNKMVYSISTAPNGTVGVEATLADDFPEEPDPHDPRNAEDRKIRRGRRLQPSSLALTSRSLQDNGDTIDIMVIFTRKAMCAQAGLSSNCGNSAANRAPIEDRINLAITETNTAFVESGVKTQLRLVYAHFEPRLKDSDGFSRLLDTITYDATYIHNLRNQHGADLVALVVDDPSYCGLAWMGPNSPLAFSVTARTCMTGYYSFGHEIAHNLGCDHDRRTISSTFEAPYAHGYLDPNGQFRSILSYKACPKPGPCTRVQRFSNTQFSYNGYPIGSPNTEDNARQINDVRTEVAQFKASVYAPLTPTPSPPMTCQFGEIPFKLDIMTDDYSIETRWELKNSNEVILSGGGNYEDFQLYTVEKCLSPGCYSFTIFDRFGDGICCNHGSGFYTVSFGSAAQKENGGIFGKEETTYTSPFCENSMKGSPTPPSTPRPSPRPSSQPSRSPTRSPSATPSTSPFASPSSSPSSFLVLPKNIGRPDLPSGSPSASPTASPSMQPSLSDGKNILVTQYSAQYIADGVMFDVIALNDIIVSTFEIHIGYALDFNENWEFQVFTKSGTFDGSDMDRHAWTKISQDDLANAANKNYGNPTTLPASAIVPQKILAGERRAFYITGPPNFNVFCVKGSTIGSVISEDSNLQIMTGKAKQYSSDFSGANFLGTSYTSPIDFSGAVVYSKEDKVDEPSTEIVPKTVGTTMASGNRQAGNMFDIVAKNDIEITSFDVHTHYSSILIKVFTKAGTYADGLTSPVLWTEVTPPGGVIVSGKGNGIYSPLPPNSFSVPVAAGKTQAFYVTSTFSTALKYTNYHTVGTVFVSNADLDFKVGVGKKYPFSSTFSPRIFNGSIHYKAQAAGDVKMDAPHFDYFVQSHFNQYSAMAQDANGDADSQETITTLTMGRSGGGFGFQENNSYGKSSKGKKSKGKKGKL